jgi:hypothetical protein
MILTSNEHRALQRRTTFKKGGKVDTSKCYINTKSLDGETALK